MGQIFNPYLRGLIPNTLTNTWTFEITNLKNEKKDLLVSMCFLVTTRNEWFCVSVHSIYMSFFYATVLGGIVVFALRLQSS